MALDLTKDVLVSIGIVGLVSKALWDWVQCRLINKDTPAIASTGDTEKIRVGNGKILPSDLSELMKGNRCSGHKELSDAVTKMLILQQEVVAVQHENAHRLDEMKDEMKTNQEVLRKDFDEAFSRIRKAEGEIGESKGDIKVLYERTRG